MRAKTAAVIFGSFGGAVTIAKSSSPEITPRAKSIANRLFSLGRRLGYGDVVSLHGEVSMLAALEGVTRVLYVAITVALLVGSYKQQNNSS
jgi:hypothetical protein